MAKFREGPAIQIFIFLFSIGILIVGVKGLFNTVKLMYFSEETNGTIVEYKSRIRDARWKWNRVPEYAPVFTFNAGDNKSINVIAGTYKEKKKYEDGAEVKVFYEKTNPDNANIKGYFEWKDLYICFMGIAGLVYTTTNVLNRNN